VIGTLLLVTLGTVIGYSWVDLIFARRKKEPEPVAPEPTADEQEAALALAPGEVCLPNGLEILRLAFKRYNGLSDAMRTLADIEKLTSEPSPTSAIDRLLHDMAIPQTDKDPE
jgi:hypothetical protein